MPLFSAFLYENFMSSQGWVKLHRQITENELWLSEPFTKGQAWIDLFLNANHKDGSFWIRGNRIDVKRGQIGWSELTMASRWKWSRKKVRHFLNYLETTQQITQQKLAKLTTILTIVKYETYQKDTTEDTTEEQQKNNRGYTNKNVKNDKNEKNDKKNNIATTSVVADFDQKSVNIILEKFQMLLNPNINYGNKTQREAVIFLLKGIGLEKLIRTIEYAASIQNDQFAPTITTPYQLKEKMAQLTMYYNKQSKTNESKVIAL